MRCMDLCTKAEIIIFYVLFALNSPINTLIPSMKHYKIYLFVLILMVSLSSNVSAQYFNGNNTFWKNQRHSFGFGIGAANFLGELGGRDQIGTRFIYDMEWSETKPALQANYRYQVTSRIFAKAQFAFALVGGNDALTNEMFRQNRNLHFRSTIYELSLQMEVDVVQFKNDSRYNLSSAATKNSSSIYVSIGAGVTRFNPKANFQGEWFALRKFGTEGQKQEGGPEQYSLFTVVLPLGVGFRYELNREWTLGIELVHRVTFTDYMDDVSTDYFDNDIIKQTQGELASHFADPSLGYFVDENGREIPLNSTFTGAQRGQPAENDAYFTLSINAYYNIQKSFKRGKGRVTKRRHRRAVF